MTEKMNTEKAPELPSTVQELRALQDSLIEEVRQAYAQAIAERDQARAQLAELREFAMGEEQFSEQKGKALNFELGRFIEARKQIEALQAEIAALKASR